MDMTSARLKKVWRSLKVPVSLLLLTTPAWLPFLRTISLPCTHDNAFHYFRITAMRDALRHGWVFSRWIPNLAIGFGYPFFNYREPFPYWIGEILYIFGIPLPLVLGIFYAATFIIAAFGAYILSRELFGDRAGWIGAVAYALGPYMLLDAFTRGNLPESFALAILPWIFLQFRRLIINGSKRAFVSALALLVILFISHNISSLLLAPFLGTYVLLLSWLYRKQKKWPMAFLVVLITLLVTAWFWMPAIFEKDMVKLAGRVPGLLALVVEQKIMEHDAFRRFVLERI